MEDKQGYNVLNPVITVIIYLFLYNLFLDKFMENKNVGLYNLFLT